jgi:hypothetical protein
MHLVEHENIIKFVSYEMIKVWVLVGKLVYHFKKTIYTINMIKEH